MAANVLMVFPSAEEALDNQSAHKFLTAVMKRFKPLIYTSLIILVVTEIIMGLFNKSNTGNRKFGAFGVRFRPLSTFFLCVL
jgi:uncharacterized membrane protein